jgi:hypothetical protein
LVASLPMLKPLLLKKEKSDANSKAT